MKNNEVIIQEIDIGIKFLGSQIFYVSESFWRAVLVVYPIVVMSPAKNTISMVVLLADSGVYLCNFFKFSPDLHNLKKSSIFPLIGLYFFHFAIFFNNSFFSVLYSFLACFSVFLLLNTCNGQVNLSFSFWILKFSLEKIKGTILYLEMPIWQF